MSSNQPDFASLRVNAFHAIPTVENDMKNVAENIIFEKKSCKKTIGKTTIAWETVDISVKNPQTGKPGSLILHGLTWFSPRGIRDCSGFDGGDKQEKQEKQQTKYDMGFCVYDSRIDSKESKELSLRYVENVNNYLVRKISEFLISGDPKKRSSVNKSLQYIGNADDMMDQIKIFTQPKPKNGEEVLPDKEAKTLYMSAKLIDYADKKDPTGPRKIATKFVCLDNINREFSNWQRLIGKPCLCTPIFRVESVYIGNTIKIQLKLTEVQVKEVEVRRQLGVTQYKAENTELISKLYSSSSSNAYDIPEEKEEDDDESYGNSLLN